MKIWVEAMRLRTLPVSVAGVVMAAGCAASQDSFKPVPVLLCLVFAVLAQIASNFANEYYDYRNGLDRPGREGPRRGVTEGDITPRQMLAATYGVLALACVVGFSLLWFGGWWLIAVGMAVGLGVLAYSTGPYPLSHHGLGEVAVILFFGVVPVCCTYILQDAPWTDDVVLASLAVGLLGANVLIVNNYRDASADKSVGKKTLAVILGRGSVRWLYLVNVAGAAVCMIPWIGSVPTIWAEVIELLIIVPGLAVWRIMPRRMGHALTPLLGITAMSMLLSSVAWLAATV